MKKIISLLLTAFMLLSVFSAVVSADEIDTGLPFTDVKEGAWYYDGIEFCYFMGIVSGMTETTFEPNGTLTRAQFVQILAMLGGVDLAEYKDKVSSFDDVKPNHWFNAPVCWAVEQGFVAGLSETRFGPNEKITREQLARLLYLFAEYCNCDVSGRADLSGYTDKPSDWAYTQVQWAVAAGIISGMDETTLAPRSSATRAQACRMIMSFDDYLRSNGKDETFYYFVDYIIDNGNVSDFDPAVTEIVEVSENGKFVLSYDSDVYGIFFEYYMGEFEYTDEYGETCIDYTGAGVISIYDISESYDLTIALSAPNGNYYVRYAEVYSKGIVPYYEEYYGFSKDYIESNCEMIQTQLGSFIMKHITEAGVAYDMIFKEHEYNRDGAYRVIADYIMANGEENEYGWYTLITLADGTDFFADHHPITGEISFRFYESYGDLSYSAGMNMYELSDSYIFSYIYEDYAAEEHVFSERTMYPDRDDISWIDYNTDEESAYAMEADAYALFCEGMAQILSECGLNMDDLYIVDDGGREMFDQLANYVVTNGVEDTETGIVDLIKEVEGKAFIAEYDPSADSLYFVYADHALPGGTNVYDTQYRTHGILEVNVPIDNEQFVYTYESEDGEKSVTVTMRIDDDVVLESLNVVGYTEEEATAMAYDTFEVTLEFYYDIYDAVFVE